MRSLQKRWLCCVLLLTATILWAEHAGAAERRSPIVAAVERASPAVVNISTAEVVESQQGPFPGFRDPLFDQFFRDFFEPQPRRFTRTSLGSGVIVRDTGYVLTNQHVVLRGARVTVTLADEHEYPAQLVGSDADSDLAVLKLDGAGHFPAVRMGSSSDLMIGETVIAIGNPFGLSHTVTVGVVSAIGRSLRSEDQTFYDLIQTDASINPGNSGGPLLNIEGEMVGVNSAIYQNAQGIGFAVPANRAKRVVDDLISYGDVQPGWIGLQVQDLTPDLVAHFGPGVRGGALVRNVEADSPAAAAGIRRGDVVLEVGNQPVRSADEWETRLRDQAIDSTVQLTLLRDEQKLSIPVRTLRFPMERADSLAWDLLGLRVQERRQHLLVEAVRRNSSAAAVGVQAGDVVVALGGQPVDTLAAFRSRMIATRNAQRVLVSIQRANQVYNVPLPLEKP